MVICNDDLVCLAAPVRLLDLLGKRLHVRLIFARTVSLVLGARSLAPLFFDCGGLHCHLLVVTAVEQITALRLRVLLTELLAVASVGIHFNFVHLAAIVPK